MSGWLGLVRGRPQCPPPGAAPAKILGLGASQTMQAATTKATLMIQNIWSVASITAWLWVSALQLSQRLGRGQAGVASAWL